MIVKLILALLFSWNVNKYEATITTFYPKGEAEYHLYEYKTQRLSRHWFYDESPKKYRISKIECFLWMLIIRNVKEQQKEQKELKELSTNI